MTPSAAPCKGSSETSSPGVPESAREPRTMWTRRARESRRSRCPRTARRPSSSTDPSRWSRRPPLDPTTTIRAGCERDRRVESELEIGRVLVGRVPLDARARRPRRPRAPCGRPSRSHRSRGRRAARVRAPGRRRRRRRSRRALGQPAGQRLRRLAPGDDDHGACCMRSSAGITQIRFCGSAARQPPSQPGCPSSPFRSHSSPATARGKAESAVLPGPPRVAHGGARRPPVRCYTPPSCGHPTAFFLTHEDLHRQAGRDPARLVRRRRRGEDPGPARDADRRHPARQAQAAVHAARRHR